MVIPKDNFEPKKIKKITKNESHIIILPKRKRQFVNQKYRQSNVICDTDSTLPSSHYENKYQQNDLGQDLGGELSSPQHPKYLSLDIEKPLDNHKFSASLTKPLELPLTLPRKRESQRNASNTPVPDLVLNNLHSEHIEFDQSADRSQKRKLRAINKTPEKHYDSLDYQMMGNRMTPTNMQRIDKLDQNRLETQKSRNNSTSGFIE